MKRAENEFILSLNRFEFAEPAKTGNIWLRVTIGYDMFTSEYDDAEYIKRKSDLWFICDKFIYGNGKQTYQQFTHQTTSNRKICFPLLVKQVDRNFRFPILRRKFIFLRCFDSQHSYASI